MTLYFKCPFRREDNEYIYALINTLYSYIDLQCEIADKVGYYMDNIILRLSDDFIRDKDEYIIEEEDTIHAILSNEISELQVCPFIELCNNYFLNKYYKQIQSLMVVN